MNEGGGGAGGCWTETEETNRQYSAAAYGYTVAAVSYGVTRGKVPFGVKRQTGIFANPRNITGLTM